MNEELKQNDLVQKMNIQTQHLTKKQDPYIEDETMLDEVKPVPYCGLFHFADNYDYLIMSIATLFSLGNGVSIVFYSIPIKQLINAFSNEYSNDQIVQATLRSVYGFLINSAILFVNCWLMTAGWTITSQRQMIKARKQYFSALLRQQISWHDRTKPAEVCSKMYIQVSKVQQGLVTNMTSVLNKISMGVSGILMALFVGYKMALVMIGFLPVMMASGFIRGYFMKQKDMYLQTKKIKLDSDVIQVFDNIKTIKILNSEQYENSRYKKNLKNQQESLWSYGWKGSLAFTFFFFCIIANYALGFWYGTKLVADQQINWNTGQLYNVSEVIVIFFTLYISNLSLSGLPDSMASFSVSRYSMRKILAIVNRVPRIREGSLSMPYSLKEIAFKNISFQYDKPLFSNFNLVFKKGTTALIGESGCGKSTIVSLLMRFYDVEKGSIDFIGDRNVNLNQLTNKSLRDSIGYVGQQPVLIGKTIREALMAEEYTDDRIFQVLALVKADQFVRDIGLYSHFQSVSGGQKQRLAIARALLKKPKILMLDQSTSALDQKTEHEVLQNIANFGVDFIIMVAHRQQTLIYADKIIKINKSKIQFEGTYNQLLKTNLIQKMGTTKKEQFAKKQTLDTQNSMQEKIQQIHEKIAKQIENKEEKDQRISSSAVFQNLEFKMSYFCELIKLNKDKWFLYLLGIIGAIYFGCIFPVFSYLISKIIFILQHISQQDPDTLPEYQRQAHLLASLLFFVSFGSLIFTTMRWIIFEYFNERIGYIVKSNAFNKLINRNYPEIQNHGPQTYSYMINKSCEDLKPLAGNFMPMIVENLVTLVVGLGIAFVYSWQITGVSLFILPLILLSSKMMMSFNHGMQSNTEEIHKKNHQMVITSIMHLKTVRSCNLQSSISNRYSQELDGALKFSIKYGNLAGILFGVGQTLISITFAIIFLIGALMIKNDYLTVQDLYTAIFAVMFAGVQAGGNLYFLGQLGAAKTGAAVYFKLIERDSHEQVFIEDASDCNKQFNGNIKFSNVRFGYKNRDKAVFDDFSLEIKAKSKIALVGQSGSGKSTIGSLLFRLYEPLGGSITIDGEEITKLSRSRLSRTLGIVMQQPALFNRSVYENIKYNDIKANSVDVMEACKSVNAYDFIAEGNFGVQEKTQFSFEKDLNQLPFGFAKAVGPRGSYLSGGQKQRISIARALVRKPKILLLDEATSALDAQNQKIVQSTIQKLSDVTQIIIAHRLSTIKNCDKIVVLRGGRVVEQGTYKELMEKGGYFSELSSSNSLKRD